MKAVIVVAAMLSAPSLAAQTDSSDPRASLFVQRGCAECHAIAALKVKAKTDAGPDLTFAYGDVRDRYGMTLDRFFDQPAGVMRLVLGGHIQLQRSDCDSLVRLFRDLYTEHLSRLDSLNRRAPPAPGSPRPAESPRRSTH